MERHYRLEMGSAYVGRSIYPTDVRKRLLDRHVSAEHTFAWSQDVSAHTVYKITQGRDKRLTQQYHQRAIELLRDTFKGNVPWISVSLFVNIFV